MCVISKPPQMGGLSVSWTVAALKCTVLIRSIPTCYIALQFIRSNKTRHSFTFLENDVTTLGQNLVYGDTTLQCH